MTSGVRTSRKQVALLVALGVVVPLLLVELSVRIATASLLQWRSKENDRHVIADPLVGRIPQPGLSVRHPNGFTITIGENGTRRNGQAAAVSSRPAVLAVGDSFAFGDGVDDEDSWPAILEQLSGRRVINAAVPGFGLDQVVLRAERLAEPYAPDTIIVSFIPHDVLRCEMSYWSGYPKPYFDIQGDTLHLNPAPTPPVSFWAPLKRLLSASVTLDRLVPRFLYWEGPAQTIMHARGRDVACRLMQRLTALGRAHDARVIVVAQPQQPTATAEQRAIKDGVLACARANQLQTLDLFPVIDALPEGQRIALFPRHMSAEGNRLVATEIAASLKSDGAAR